MPVGCHVVVSCVDDGLTIAFNIEHTSPKHMACVVRGYLHIVNLDCLVQLNCLDLVDAVSNHFRAEAIHFPFLGDGDFAEVLQH
jgi:hypothetical protein